MATSFNRVCNLTIGVAGETIDASGLRIGFEIEKSSIGYPNIAKIFVYNLSESTRNRLVREFDEVKLDAGYLENSGTIFQGQITNAFNRRSQPDWITEIYAKDGIVGYREGTTNVSYGRNVEVRRIVEGLIADLNLDLGEINADLSARKINGWTFSGKSRDALSQLAEDYNFNWGIQSNRIYICSNSIPLRNRPSFEISAQTGLVSSPVVTEVGANFSTLLNWQLVPNEWVRMVSDSQFIQFQNIPFIPNIIDRVGFGDYIARRIIHTGDTRAKEWYTAIEGFRYNAT